MTDHDGRKPASWPRGARKPPPHIWNAMVEAGRTGDTQRLGIANAQYHAWLKDND